ncbi:hypothetical protein [Burkholderia glumae]|uniref:hypothetical protein n=1 Tax=Burkholderia glumae TaxID=337 RepID=UPI0011D1E0CF|nr:hypothetical protein [Burkholderia glumae]
MSIVDCLKFVASADTVVAGLIAAFFWRKSTMVRVTMVEVEAKEKAGGQDWTGGNLVTDDSDSELIEVVETMKVQAKFNRLAALWACVAAVGPVIAGLIDLGIYFKVW